MLEKCVVVRACRFVCPNLVGDLPYTMEEMLQAKGFNEKSKETQDFTDKNTLYGKYKEFLNLDEEEAEKYMFGDPEIERDQNGMLKVKIWKL